MRKVVSGSDLQDKMIFSVNLLCDTVKCTLGPKGNNVIIDNSDNIPYITNDGVTIAKNIESDDEVINTILELAKESTINTNDNVGDGTTTTLVLLQSIFNEGIKEIKNGKNPIILKKELDISLKEVIELIKNKSRKPNEKELLNIARISGNDIEIGNIIYDVFSKIKDKDFINLVEGKKDSINYIKGYVMDTILASPYFLENKEIIYDNPYILLSDSVIYDLECISEILDYTKNKSLIIISTDYDDNFINQILSLVINEKYKIVLLKIPEYGNRQINILKDIECISLGKINHENFDIKKLGMIRKIKINKENTILDFSINSDIKNRILELKSYINNENDDYEKEFYKKRLSMLKNKTAEIIIGGNSKTEIKEKKMRYEDALCSISSAYNGVLIGSGLVLYEISESINNNILKNALKSPLKQIIYNAGLDNNIISKIEDNKYKQIYNVSTDKFEDINLTNIIDSTDVVFNSIINATSVAGMLLSTTSLVINEFKENNLNDYNNL